MDKNYNEYIFKYINGNVSEEEAKELEQQDDFMKKVITISRNKKFYEKASDKVKGDGEFVLKIIDMFKDDHGFIAMVGELFYELNDYDSKRIFEVTVALTRVYKETQDDILFDFYNRSEGFYKSVLHSIRQELMEMEDPEERAMLGEGFGFVNVSYSDSELTREFIAERLTEDLLLNNPMYEFEELVHYINPLKDKIPDGYERRFIFEYLTSVDKELGNFLGLHPRLTDKYIPMLVEVKDNWDNYLEELNTYKLQQVQDEMERYIVEKNLSYDMMELYRGMIDLSKRRDKIYKYLPAEELNDKTYKRVDMSQLSLPEYGFVTHMIKYMDDAFEEDVPYDDMELVNNYYEKPIENVSSIKPYLKKRD